MKDKYEHLLKRQIKKIDFKNVSFKNKLNSESTKVYKESREQKKRLIIQNSSHSGKQHQYNFAIFLGLGRFAENFYNGNLSLKAANIEQKNMEDIIRKLEYYDPKKKKYRTQKTTTC